MLLKELTIRREYWVEGKPLKGEIEFDDPAGAIKLNLDEEQCARMLAIVADALVVTTKKIASELTSNVIAGAASLKSLKGPSDA